MNGCRWNFSSTYKIFVTEKSVCVIMLPLVPDALASKAGGKIQAAKWDLGLDWKQGKVRSECLVSRDLQYGAWINWYSGSLQTLTVAACLGVCAQAGPGQAAVSAGLLIPKIGWKEGEHGSLWSVICWSREGNNTEELLDPCSIRGL